MKLKHRQQILIIGANSAIIRNSIFNFLDNDFEVIGISKSGIKDKILKKHKNFKFHKFNLFKNFDQIIKLCKYIDKKYPYIISIIHAQGGSFGYHNIINEYNRWEELWKINFASSVIINNYFIKNFQKNNFGRILHFGSTVTDIKKGSPIYSSTKAATYDYVKKMGNNFSEKNVYINCIKTSIVSDKDNNWNKFEKMNTKKTIAKILKENLSTEKFGRSKYFTPIITYLCSKNNQFITGSIIDIDGGFIK